jgi:membrane associated rhomboid family serine protease
LSIEHSALILSINAIIEAVFERKRTGSVLCASCGVLVGVNDDTCYNCGRRNPSLWGYAPALRALGADLGVVPVLIGGNVAIFGFSLLRAMTHGGIQMGGMLSMFGPGPFVSLELGASGVVPVFEWGRWWTVLSAGWLHGGILHLVFNMMALRQLAPAIAELYGPARMTIIYVVASIVGFTCSSLAGRFLPDLPLIGAGLMTVGASASIAGLIGALWHYGRRGGSRMAQSHASTYVLYMVVIGFMGGIDNWAHAGGFAGGYLAARFLDPLTRERTDHIVVALVCLIVSLASVVVSFLIPLPRGI